MSSNRRRFLGAALAGYEGPPSGAAANSPYRPEAVLRDPVPSDGFRLTPAVRLRLAD